MIPVMSSVSITVRRLREVMEEFSTYSVPVTVQEFFAEAEPSSDIFVVTGTSGGDGGIVELVGLMGDHGLRFYRSEESGRSLGPDGLLSRDDLVILKVNSQWDERGGTNSDLLKALIGMILNHPDGFVGEIVVADNGQAQFGAKGNGGSFSWERNNAEDPSQSIERVVDSYSASHRVSAYLWDHITTRRVREYSEGDLEDGFVVEDLENPRTGIRVSYPKFRTRYGTYVSFKLGVWDPERGVYDGERVKVLNIPVLKSHRIFGVTASVKSYMGVTSDKLTAQLGVRAHSTVGSGGMGTQMVETRFPTLNILDAIWVNANPLGGPRTTYNAATRVNIIASSRDPVALDYWAAKHILIPAARLKGFSDTSSMDPDNRAKGSFGDWLRLSMEEMIRAGIQATMDEAHMNVYVASLG